MKDHSLNGDNRSFLFLQGPHGPFFHALGKALVKVGARVTRVGFNAGDKAFWPSRDTYIRYTGNIEDWPRQFRELISSHGITDIVLYGDARPVHTRILPIAQEFRITVHFFEEGYMRPYWITYERDGVNGGSTLMRLGIAEMRKALEAHPRVQPDAPSQWGELRRHIFYGAAYHFFVLTMNKAYKAIEPHRGVPLSHEFRLYLRRFLMLPFVAAQGAAAARRLRRGDFSYHLVLLQLEHDASFRKHSPFTSQSEFVERAIEGFARGAPAEHRLVFKSHPLEPAHWQQSRMIADVAKRHGVNERVEYVSGGKLGRLLDRAASAVTVNSTAGQQALWRGLPLKALGDAVYAKPELVSSQPMDDFFAEPIKPDIEAYLAYRQFLLETSQIPGGFYSALGRRQVIRHVTRMMLAPSGPYEALAQTGADGQTRALRDVS